MDIKTQLELNNNTLLQMRTFFLFVVIIFNFFLQIITVYLVEIL